MEREEHPPDNLPPTSNLPKVVVIRAVPSCRNAVSWDTIIAPKADAEGEGKKKKKVVGANERREVDRKTAQRLLSTHKSQACSHASDGITLAYSKVGHYDDKTLPPD